ncbi:nitrate- and nitrite sensing domain-containing protein [Parafrankia elaeagni]|uniref:nitrate- and nitrite sensing domain-containing protein n=1 Tax=Parafrankia elaeagni TaxID=222534 RepID=UPI0003799822|nr:nitrate- and nitrite sensing domain-containing protein [Parafrankia elaeagni]
MASTTGMAADQPPMPAAGSPVEGDGHHDDQPPMPPRPERSGRRGLRQLVTDPTNWRVRTKLIAILAVPVVAILVNSSIQAASVLTSTRDVNRIRDLIEINRSAAPLIYALQQERTFTTSFVATRPGGVAPSVTVLQTAVDDALAGYRSTADRRRGSFGPEVSEALVNADTALGRIEGIRTSVARIADPDSVRTAYKPIIDSLIDLVILIPQGNDDQELLTSVNANDHLVRADEELANAQALAHGVIVGAQPFSTDDYREFLTTYSQRTELIRAFERDATPAQLATYRDNVSVENPDIALTALYTEQILDAPTDVPLTTPAAPASDKWARVTKETLDRSNEVSASLVNDADDRVDELRGGIQRGALLSGLLIVFILATALLAAVVVARSLVRPLLSLRTAALDVAGRRLPEAVRRLRDSTDQTLDDDVEAIGIDSDEEIGEVARAFDAVHREAVRLASEQAVLRNNVNAMFVNLSRRSQGLVERQLRLIDDLENREQDPDQLANLFKLDHLATRMRRNNESLLVLAGTDTARRWTHPVPVNEVVLAAISEVEQYTRVKQTGAAPVSIAGSGVSDVVHLIAELLENATSYSPPVTDVAVSSHSLGPGAGAMIEIEDQGIGMPAKELERVNERLANPPVVDVSVSRTMGLFAVGRLASRHGIRVQLRESASGGITAVVRLPAKLVTGDSGALPSGPRPGAIAPANGRDAGSAGGRGPAGPAGPAGPPALPPAPERNGIGSGLQTTSFNPIVDPATASAAGGSSVAPGGNGAGFGQAPGGGFTSPGGASLFGGPRPPRPDSAEPAGRGERDGWGERDDRAGRNGQFARDTGSGPGSTGPDRFDAGPPAGFPDQGRSGPEDSAEYPLEAFDSGSLPHRGGTGYDQGGYDQGGYAEEPHTGERPYTYPLETGGRRAETGPQQHTGPRGYTGPQELTGPREHTGPLELPGHLDRPGPNRGPDAGRGLTDSNGYPLADVRGGDDLSGPLQIGPPSGPNQVYSEPDTDALSRPGGVFNRGAGRPAPDTGDPFPRTGPGLAAAFRGNREIGPGETGPNQSSTFGHAEDTGETATGELEDDETFTTPIFDSVSAWFQRKTPPPANGAGNGNGAVNGRPAPGRRGQAPAGPPVQATPLPRRAQPAQPQAPARPGTGIQPPGPPRSPLRGEPALDSPGRGIRRPGPGVQVPAAAAQAPRQVPQTGPQPMAPAGQAADGSWSSAGDEGWKAAEQLRQPSAGGTTRSGLPVRVPMTHLVPGSAEPAPSRRPPEPAATRSPQAVGGRLASFYQGVRQGRDVGVDTTRNPRRDAQEER